MNHFLALLVSLLGIVATYNVLADLDYCGQCGKTGDECAPFTVNRKLDLIQNVTQDKSVFIEYAYGKGNQQLIDLTFYWAENNDPQIYFPVENKLTYGIRLVIDYRYEGSRSYLLPASTSCQLPAPASPKSIIGAIAFATF